MENASKALIIAGAILMSILLISIGILMFNSAKGTTNQANPTGDLVSLEAAIATIDIQFSKYNGVQNKETVVKMLEEVAEYNSSSPYNRGQGDDDTTKLIRKIAVHGTTITNASTTQAYGGNNSIVPAYRDIILNYPADEFRIETQKLLDTENKDDPSRDFVYIIFIKENK